MMHLVNEAFERRVLGALLCEPEMLEHVPDLEVNDFYGYPHRAIMACIRNLQAAGVKHTLERVGLALERVVTSGCSLWPEIGMCALEPAYSHVEILLAGTRLLRTIARDRHTLENA